MTDSARVTELKEALRDRAAFLQKGLDSVEIQVDGDNTYVKQEDVAVIRKARQDCDDIKELLAAELFGGEVKSFLEAPAAQSAALAAAAGETLALPQFKTLGEMFTASDEFKHLITSRKTTMDEPWMYEGKDIAALGTFDRKDVFASMNPGSITRTFGSIQFDPLVPRGQRVNRVRDLFPVANTQANLIDYFQVVGFSENSGDGNASPVRDRTSSADTGAAPAGNSTDLFGKKPHSNLVFRSNQAPVRTIAHWEAAHRNALQDEPQLQATINNELLYGLALEEDYQILQGSGTGEDLLGLLNTPNIQTYTPGGTEIKSDSLRRAATKAVIANYAPTGYVLHPNDWEDVELQKGASTGNDHYMLFTNVAIGLSAQIWRQPVVETVAMPEGTFLTGAFGIGAQLYDRQQANIRISESHSDFFIRNAIVILCEERLALATKRPESFVMGSYNAP